MPISAPSVAGAAALTLALAAAATVALPAGAASDSRRSTLANKSSAPAGPANGASGAISEQRLAALMPEQAGAWHRVGLGNPVPGSETDYQPAMRAEYARGDDRAQVELADLGKAGSIAARALKADPAPKAIGSGQQRVYLAHGRLIREELDHDAGLNSASVVFANGFSLRVSGKALDAAALQQLVEAIDLAGIDALRRAPR